MPSCVRAVDEAAGRLQGVGGGVGARAAHGLASAASSSANNAGRAGLMLACPCSLALTLLSTQFATYISYIIYVFVCVFKQFDI